MNSDEKNLPDVDAELRKEANETEAEKMESDGLQHQDAHRR